MYPDKPIDKEGNVIIEAGKIFFGYIIWIHESLRGSNFAVGWTSSQIVNAKNDGYEYFLGTGVSKGGRKVI